MGPGRGRSRKEIAVKHLFVWGRSVALFFVLGGLASAELEVIQDEFDGTTQIRTTPRGEVGHLDISFFGVLSRTPEELPYIHIFLEGAFQEWQYGRCFSTEWLLDGRPFLLPEATRDGSLSSSGGVVETLNISPISMQQLELMARAKKIEFKVCNDEYSASPEELQDLRAFFSKIKGLVPK
jgi:hypothetical protein